MLARPYSDPADGAVTSLAIRITLFSKNVLPQWVITVTYLGSRTKQVSVTAEQLPQIREWIANYRQIKEALEAISDVHWAKGELRRCPKAASQAI